MLYYNMDNINNDVDWDFWNSDVPLKDAKKYDNKKKSDDTTMWNPLDDLPFFY